MLGVSKKLLKVSKMVIKINKTKLIQEYLYTKLCYARSSGHIEPLLALVNRVMLLAIFLNVFELDNYYILGVVAVVYVYVVLMVGHYDIKKGVNSKEISLQNKYNPEIQKLINNIK